jgi:hypothetical protein
VQPTIDRHVYFFRCGTAQVRNGRTLVLYTNEVGVHERAIAMDRDTLIGDILYLDDYSYVRGEC